MAMNLPQTSMLALAYSHPVFQLEDVREYVNGGEQDEHGWKSALIEGVVLNSRGEENGNVWFCLQITQIHVAGQDAGILLRAPLEAHISIGKYRPQANMAKQADKANREVVSLEMLMQENTEISNVNSGLLIFQFHIHSKAQKTLITIEQMLSAGGNVVGFHRRTSSERGYGPGFHLSVRMERC